MINLAKVSLKSPVIMAGLFCLCFGLLSCLKATDPTDVTILFWTAVSESNLKKAQQYALEGSEIVIDKKNDNFSLQLGKTEIDDNHATVETSLFFQSAANNQAFKTHLVRKKTGHWKVDYKTTQKGIQDKDFKNLIQVLKDAGKQAKQKTKEAFFPTVKNFFASLLEGLKKIFQQILEKT